MGLDRFISSSTYLADTDIDKLYIGIGKLYIGISKLYIGIGKLYIGIGKLYIGIGKLYINTCPINIGYVIGYMDISNIDIGENLGKMK